MVSRYSDTWTIRLTMVLVIVTLCATNVFGDIERGEFAWSPDGNAFVFNGTVVDANGAYTYIWLVNPVKRILEKVTKGKAPDWAPDGKSIVFVRDNIIRTRNMLTGDERELSSLAEFAVVDNPVWSPDGKQIAFMANRGGYINLWMMDANGGNKTCLLKTTDHEADPCWSPDGSMIVFNAINQRGNSNICILKPGDIPIQLAVTNEENFNITPSWSKVADIILFDSFIRRGSNGGLWLATFNQDKLKELMTRVQSMGFTPGLPDGLPSLRISPQSFTAFEEAAKLQNLFVLSHVILSPSDSYVDGTHGGGYHSPKYSPDGASILASYSQGGAGVDGICTISPDGLQVRQIIANTVGRVEFVTDAEPPILQVNTPHQFTGLFTINCVVSDNTAVTKVAIFLNDENVATFLKPPFSYTLDVDALRKAKQSFAATWIGDLPDGRKHDTRTIPVSNDKYDIVIQAFDATGNMSAKHFVYK
ncbi:MAG TPA: Ig-like domain-containing protein [Armatimonadota bacterium]|nr:Ig-like domain-containing protein [Armatimonadota bacterium]